MQAQNFSRALAIAAFVALQKIFLELPRWIQLSVLATEVMILGLATISVKESCEELAHASNPRPVLPQPHVFVPLKGERDDAESDVETESTAGTEAAGTDTESDAEVDSDWSSSEDVETPCNCCFTHDACEVRTRLAAVLHLAASEPITSDDEDSLSVARCPGGRASADVREVAAFGLSSSDRDGNDDDCDKDIVSSSKITCSRQAHEQAPERDGSIDPWVTIGCRLSGALSEIGAMALDDEEDFPQLAFGWCAVGGRVAVALRQIASGEPTESDDEDGFPLLGQSLHGCII